MFDKDSFSNRLQKLRSEKKITAKTLSEELGLSKAAISQFEKGVNYPHCNTLCKLGDYFNVSLDYLAGRSDDPTRY